MGYDFGTVNFYIQNHPGYSSLEELRDKLEEMFPTEDSDLKFEIEAGEIHISCPYDNPAYATDDALEEIASFLGPKTIVVGGARFEDGSDVYYREIVDGQVVCAHSEWLEKYSARFINRLEDLAEWLVEFTPEEFKQLQDQVIDIVQEKHDN